MINQLAAATNRLATEIVEYREWQHVYFVRFISGRPTFVSKAAVNSPSPVIWKLTGNTPSEQTFGKWVNRIEKDGLYMLQRIVVKPQDIEWGTWGTTLVTFVIDEPGYYLDSNNHYFQVFDDGDELGYRICSYQEVRNHFNLVAA